MPAPHFKAHQTFTNPLQRDVLSVALNQNHGLAPALRGLPLQVLLLTFAVALGKALLTAE
jgi:hypothetical protein